MVMTMRRTLAALAVLGLFMTALLHAQAGSAAPYPPTTQAQIMASTTTPFQKQKIEVSGLHYHANEDVRLTIGGIFVGTAHTDASGSFDPPVIVPALSGAQTLVGAGASGAADDTASLVLTVRVPSTTTPSGGGLAFTGVQIGGMIAGAAVLLAGGVFLTTAGRRRKNAVRV
jgi:hypothetical protein